MIVKMREIMRATVLENEDSDSVEDDENCDHDSEGDKRNTDDENNYTDYGDDDEMATVLKIGEKNVITIRLKVIIMTK